MTIPNRQLVRIASIVLAGTLFGCVHENAARLPASTGSSIADCEPAFEALEIIARTAEESRFPETAKADLIHLADKYLEANKYQEAIWTLNRAGEKDRAATVAQELETKLREGKPIKWTYLGGNAYRVDLDNGISGVHKAVVDSRYEVATYKIDKRLGLNIVPMTVQRTFDKPGSFQYFVDDTHGAGALNPFHPRGQTAYYSASRPYGIREQRFLDEWVDQRDRKEANFGIRAGNQVVSWDNMNAYKPNQGVSDSPQSWMPGEDVWKRFQAYTPGEIRKDLESDLKPEEIDRLVRRRELMLQVGNASDN